MGGGGGGDNVRNGDISWKLLSLNTVLLKVLKEGKLLERIYLRKCQIYNSLTSNTVVLVGVILFFSPSDCMGGY